MSPAGICPATLSAVCYPRSGPVVELVVLAASASAAVAAVAAAAAWPSCGCWTSAATRCRAPCPPAGHSSQRSSKRKCVLDPWIAGVVKWIPWTRESKEYPIHAKREEAMLSMGAQERVSCGTVPLDDTWKTGIGTKLRRQRRFLSYAVATRGCCQLACAQRTQPYPLPTSSTSNFSHLLCVTQMTPRLLTLHVHCDLSSAV